MSQEIIQEKSKRILDVRWFSNLKEARAWIRSLGPEWKPWTEIEPAGFCRKSGWKVRVFEPLMEEE
ncbi:MAG: hypothetical protein NUV70_04480 [Caldiserica bacterium]|jgi:hypothetical protein|nr:hypothetical protein [Caldisericota bacterium]